MSLLETRPVADIPINRFANKDGMSAFVQELMPESTAAAVRTVVGPMWTVFVTQPNFLQFYHPDLRLEVRCYKCQYLPTEYICKNLTSQGPYSTNSVKRYTLVEKRSVVRALPILRELRDRNNIVHAQRRLSSMKPVRYAMLVAWVNAGFPGNAIPARSEPIPLCGGKT